MSQFATTVERFLRRARQEHIDRLYLESRQGSDRVTKKALAEALPRPDVSVTPILAEESIDEFLERFSVLTSIRISLAPVNEEPDLNEFFKQLREQKDSVGAGKAQLEYRGTKTNGLNIEPAADQLKAATDGHAEFQVEGLDQNGRPLKGDNEEFKVKVPLDIDTPAVRDAANRMASAFRSLVDSDAVRPGQAEERHEATLLGIIARLGR